MTGPQPSLRSLRRTVLLLAIGCAGSVAGRAFGDEPCPAHNQAETHDQALPGVMFAIEPAEGRTEYHVGELIPIELVFRFTESGRYELNTWTTAVSDAVMCTEVFCATPAAGVALVPVYLDVRSLHPGQPAATVEGQQYRCRVYLNDWLRFDQPGQYRVQCITARVWKRDAHREGRETELRLRSSSLDLRIVASGDDWKDRECRDATQSLHDVADTAPRLEAIRRLGLLQTEAAARQLARAYRGRQFDAEDHEIAAGLYASPCQAAAVAEMEKKLTAPQFVVTETYLRELATLAVTGKNQRGGGGDRAMPGAPGAVQVQAISQRLAQYVEQVFDAAERKAPVAAAMTLIEMYAMARNSGRWPPLSAERLERARAATAAVLERLPPECQFQVLACHWRGLGGKDLLPGLRRLIHDAPTPTESLPAFGALDVALQRLQELSPDESRRAILEEIRRDTPRAARETLAVLDDALLPELDTVLLNRFVRADGASDDGDRDAFLIARYASAAILDPILANYSRASVAPWPCDPQASVLAYVLRHRPEVGARLVNEALDRRASTGCYRMLLTDVARVRMSPQLARIAVKRLDDSDLGVATDAATVLGHFGGDDAQPALWQRLQRWHDSWNGQPQAFPASALAPAEDGPAAFESALVRALATSPHWIAGPDLLGRIRQMCRTDAGRQLVDFFVSLWNDPIDIGFQAGVDSEFPSAPYHVGVSVGDTSYLRDRWFVAQYYAETLSTLRTLLLRFPMGTTFRLPVVLLMDSSADERLFNELRRAVSENGLKLIRGPRQQPEDGSCR